MSTDSTHRMTAYSYSSACCFIIHASRLTAMHITYAANCLLNATNIHRVWKKVYGILNISLSNLNIFSQIVVKIHFIKISNFLLILQYHYLVITLSKMPFLL